MALVLVATSGAANANSFLTLAEAVSYFESRITIPEWDDAESQEALLVMATRLISSLYTPSRRLFVSSDGCSYYRIRSTWTGAPASTTQVLPWPRTGMFDRNGNAIASSVIPQDLKNATAELAGHLAKGDRTFDSDTAVQGITNVRAGSVSVSFKDDASVTKILPDVVMDLLVPSWITDETIEPANRALFDVVSN